MPKQKKSAKTQENQEQQETQIKYIRSNKIEEIEKKCSDYKKIQEQIQELGFPVNPASDQIIKEIIEKQDQIQLGKYLASHYWGKQSDLLTKVNEKLVEYGFQVTDDLQCEQIITIINGSHLLNHNINNNNIGKKYDYKKLFDLKDTTCPSQLLNVDHFSSEIITKFVESTDNPELQQLQTIRKNIQDLLNKLDKIRIFSNKLQNIKSQSAEDKLLKQYDNLEKDYYLVKNTQFNFDKLTQQKKTKSSKKKGNPNEGDNNQEIQQNKDQKQEELIQKDIDQQDQNQLNTNQEQKNSDKAKQLKKSIQKQSKKNKEQINQNQEGEQNPEKGKNKKEKKTKKQETKQEKITENQELLKQSQNKMKKSVDNQNNTKKESKQKIKKTNTQQQTQDDPKQKKLDQFFKKKTQ